MRVICYIQLLRAAVQAGGMLRTGFALPNAPPFPRSTYVHTRAHSLFVLSRERRKEASSTCTHNLSGACVCPLTRTHTYIAARSDPTPPPLRFLTGLGLISFPLPDDRRAVSAATNAPASAIWRDWRRKSPRKSGKMCADSIACTCTLVPLQLENHECF